MSDNTFRLVPFHTGQCMLGQNHVLGDGFTDEDRIAFTLYSFFADGGPGRRVLVDLGPGALPYLNDMFRRFGFFRDLPGDPDAIQQPHGDLFDWLRRENLTPEDIDHIIITHLHADHHGLTDATDGGTIQRMPNARIHISKLGWEYNLAKRNKNGWNSYIDYAFGDYLLEAEKQGRLNPIDDAEIIPGLDVIYLGGHSPCSMGVRFQTATHPAIVTSDDLYQYQLLEKGIVGRLHTTPEQLLASNTRLADLALAGHVLLPCHEPQIFECYEQHRDDWLTALKPISDRAAKGFKKTEKNLLSGSSRESE